MLVLGRVPVSLIQDRGDPGLPDRVRNGGHEPGGALAELRWQHRDGGLPGVVGRDVVRVILNAVVQEGQRTSRPGR